MQFDCFYLFGQQLIFPLVNQKFPKQKDMHRMSMTYAQDYNHSHVYAKYLPHLDLSCRYMDSAVHFDTHLATLIE